MTKEAKEMFEELGYKKLPKHYNKHYIFYEKMEQVDIDKYEKKIVWFSLSNKTIQFSPYLRYTLKELKAINKQVEELRWNNE